MYTSNYRSLASIRPPLSPVGISRGKPRWLKGGWLAHVASGTVGRNADYLAPTAAALKMDRDGYNAAFAAILRGLDPTRVYADLGEDAVLLCFCPAGQFCHRRLVAEWIEDALGVLVPELGVDRLDTPICVTAEYDWWRGSHDSHWDHIEGLVAAGGKLLTPR